MRQKSKPTDLCKTCSSAIVTGKWRGKSVRLCQQHYHASGLVFFATFNWHKSPSEWFEFRDDARTFPTHCLCWSAFTNFWKYMQIILFSGTKLRVSASTRSKTTSSFDNWHFPSGWLPVGFRKLDYFLNNKTGSTNRKIHVQMGMQPRTRGASRWHNSTEFGWGWRRLDVGEGKKGLENWFIAGRRARTPHLDLKFTAPSGRKILSGGLREPSRITHQLGKGDLEQNLGL